MAKKSFSEIGESLRASVTEQVRDEVQLKVERDAAAIALTLKMRQARIDANLSQSDLALLAGITQAELSRIEGAKYFPRLDTILKVSQALGVGFAIDIDPKRLAPHLVVQ